MRLHGDGQYRCYKGQGTTRVGRKGATPAVCIVIKKKKEPIKPLKSQKKKNPRAKFKKKKRHWLPNTGCFSKNTIRVTETQGRPQRPSWKNCNNTDKVLKGWGSISSEKVTAVLQVN